MKYGKAGKKKFTSVQCTGMFKTSKKGLYVGSTTDEYFDKFVEKVKEAKKSERGVTFFLWRNDPDKSEAAFTLYMDENKPFKKKGRKIEEDDGDQSEETSPSELDEDDDEEPEGDPFDD